jgi:hypothetical protein
MMRHFGWSWSPVHSGHCILDYWTHQGMTPRNNVMFIEISTECSFVNEFSAHFINGALLLFSDCGHALIVCACVWALPQPRIVSYHGSVAQIPLEQILCVHSFCYLHHFPCCGSAHRTECNSCDLIDLNNLWLCNVIFF